MSIWSHVDHLNFSFCLRNQAFDWRKLHGVDIDAVVRNVDVLAVEDILDCLRHGNLSDESPLSIHNYIQLIRLLQVAVTYLLQLREAHSRLFDLHLSVMAAARRWRVAVEQYLHCAYTARQALLAPLSGPQGPRGGGEAAVVAQALAAAEDAWGDLHAQETAFNDAVDQLEGQQLGGTAYRFQRGHMRMSWQAVHGISVRDMVACGDPSPLEPLLPMLAGADLADELRQAGGQADGCASPANLCQLVSVLQCGLDYLCFQCEATGDVLHEADAELDSEMADMPSLTSETEGVRAALEGEQQLWAAAQRRGADPCAWQGPSSLGHMPGSPPPSLYYQASPPHSPAHPPGVMAAGYPPGSPFHYGGFSPVAAPHMEAERPGVYVQRTGGTWPPPAAVGVQAVPCGPLLGMWGTCGTGGISLSQVSTASSAEMFAKAGRMKDKLGDLERDLREERGRMSDMRRCFSEIELRLHDAINAAAAGDSAADSASAPRRKVHRVVVNEGRIRDDEALRVRTHVAQNLQRVQQLLAEDEARKMKRRNQGVRESYAANNKGEESMRRRGE